MKNDDIRFYIAHKLPAVQSVMLTQQQWDVLQFIIRMKPNFVRSSTITSEFGLSPQHTANITKTLFEKGYVSKCNAIAPSGGPEHEFRFRIRKPPEGDNGDV